MELLFVILLVWLLPAFVIAWMAGQKGRSGISYFLLSVFLSPLVPFLILLVVPTRTQPSGMKNCPTCHQSFDGTKFWSCPHCKAAAARKTKNCPMCAEPILVEARKCKHCGSDLEAQAVNQP